MSRRFRRHSTGFTLIEAIMVMVITGILVGAIAVFISKPVESYVDSARRAELTDQADVALRRMTRDIRLALPNSLRLKDSSNATVTSCSAGTECYVEFILTKFGARYRDPGDGSTGGNFLDFTGTLSNPSCPGTPSLCFDILGSSPTNPPNIANGDSIVVYNLGAGYAPADAYIAAGNRTTVTLTSGTPYYATMASNVFAAQSPPLPSPDSRFQVIGQNDKVVRYGCVGGALTRQSNCSFTATDTCAATAVLAGSASAEPKATCELDYQATATGRNGLLYVRLILTDTPSGESVSLFQQIHVDNAP
ncbi:MAG: methylation [Rhodocyclaceae bacterium]|jgi:MSHA biogenesis protein MshO|nr:MAG: methylation [Rhodocyclaceae bacterium]TNC99249.1 MAG: methylation [Rhodocyclaceae bacterium]